ncbi:hypothetical protein HispidOSU_031587 [Sigmodon hispidus]
MPGQPGGREEPKGEEWAGSTERRKMSEWEVLRSARVQGRARLAPKRSPGCLQKPLFRSYSAIRTQGRIWVPLGDGFFTRSTLEPGGHVHPLPWAQAGYLGNPRVSLVEGRVEGDGEVQIHL